MDMNDTRHFPLTLGVYNLSRMVCGAMFAAGSPNTLVYCATPHSAYLMDSLIKELGETAEYETIGAARYAAVLFAVDAMKAYRIDPADMGFVMPMHTNG